MMFNIKPLIMYLYQSALENRWDKIKIHQYVDSLFKQLNGRDFITLQASFNDFDNESIKAFTNELLEQKAIFNCFDLEKNKQIELLYEIFISLKNAFANKAYPIESQLYQSSVILKSVILHGKNKKESSKAYPRIPHFVIKGLLGEGGASRVYFAVFTKDGIKKSCALKVGLLENESQFQKEVALMKALQHSNLLSCDDSGTFEENGVKYYWIAMPNLGGLTVEDLILEGKLDLENQLMILIQILNGLIVLHQNHIIHHDLKPGNCLISPDFDIKLSDFGLSTQLNQQAQDISKTVPLQLLGTPAYMSPEQAKNQKHLISYQSDIWAFGMICFEMLVGDLPWGRKLNYFECIGNIQHLDIPMHQLFAVLRSDKLKSIIQKCLEKDLSKRYQSLDEFKNAFIQECYALIAQHKMLQQELTQKRLKQDQILEKYIQNTIQQGQTPFFSSCILYLSKHPEYDDLILDTQRFKPFFQSVAKVYETQPWYHAYQAFVFKKNHELAKIDQQFKDEVNTVLKKIKDDISALPEHNLFEQMKQLQQQQENTIAEIKNRLGAQRLAIDQKYQQFEASLQACFEDQIKPMILNLFRDEEEKFENESKHPSLGNINEILIGVGKNGKKTEELKKGDKLIKHKKSYGHYVLGFIAFIAVLSVLQHFKSNPDPFGEALNDSDDSMEQTDDTVNFLSNDQEYLNDAGIKFIKIRGGSFMMGSEDKKPVHRVNVRDFYMSKTEVTVGQYRKCVEAGVCSKAKCKWVGSPNWSDRVGSWENHPINCVDWTQARAFAKWVGGDLPSEAQWEYAARSGGRDIKYPARCQLAVMDGLNHWLDESMWVCGQKRTREVCSETGGNTAQGLCDMGGNVWEWVLDEWHGSYSGAPADDRGWCSDRGCSSSTSANRVRRGGSWSYNASNLPYADRYGNSPGFRYDALGFRVSRSVN